MRFARAAVLLAAAAPALAQLNPTALAEASTQQAQVLSLFGGAEPAKATAAAASLLSAAASQFASDTRAFPAAESFFSSIQTDAAARKSYTSQLAALYPSVYGDLVSSSSSATTTGPSSSAATKTGASSGTSKTTGSASAATGGTSSTTTSASKGAAPTGAAIGGALGVVGLAAAVLL